MIRTKLLSLMMLAAGIAAAQPAPLTGRLLSAATGRPIAGATVNAVRQGTSGRPVVLRSATRQDGTFATGEAPEGSYRLCVYDVEDFLDPCQWSSEPPTVVAAGSAPGVIIRLQQGLRLSLRIGDPLRMADAGAGLPTQSGNRMGPISAAYVDGSGRRRVLPVIFESEGIFEYADVVPADADVVVVVSSERFLLADEAGAPIPDGHGIRVRAVPDARPIVDPRIRLPFTAVGPRSATVALVVRGVR